MGEVLQDLIEVFTDNNLSQVDLLLGKLYSTFTMDFKDCVKDFLPTVTSEVLPAPLLAV